MNLIIDIGNSRTKAAIFSGQELVEAAVFAELTDGALRSFTGKYPAISHALLSAVGPVDPAILTFLQNTFSYFLELNHHTPMPIRNAYKTPETLGLDRLAAVIGARELFREQDILVIDAGTALTFDLLEANGTFVGGNISPGLRSRFRALHDYTEKLPLIALQEDWPMIGRSTEEAILAGVVQGMIFELEGVIALILKKYPTAAVVLTGGDAHYFERRLKNPIFVKFEITLTGLNRILEYNVEKQ